MSEDNLDKTREALSAYLEQFTGEERMIGIVTVTGDAVRIDDFCPNCYYSNARRASFITMDGKTSSDIHWRCEYCGQVF